MRRLLLAALVGLLVTTVAAGTPTAGAAPAHLTQTPSSPDTAVPHDGPDGGSGGATPEGDEGPTARTWGFVILFLATSLFLLDRIGRAWGNRRLAKEHEREQRRDR